MQRLLPLGLQMQENQGGGDAGKEKNASGDLLRDAIVLQESASSAGGHGGRRGGCRTPFLYVADWVDICRTLPCCLVYRSENPVRG